MDFGFWVLRFGFWEPCLRQKEGSPVGFWILGVGSWVLNFGFWALDFGFWVPQLPELPSRAKLPPQLSPQLSNNPPQLSPQLSSPQLSFQRGQ